MVTLGVLNDPTPRLGTLACGHTAWQSLRHMGILRVTQGICTVVRVTCCSLYRNFVSGNALALKQGTEASSQSVWNFQSTFLFHWHLLSTHYGPAVQMASGTVPTSQEFTVLLQTGRNQGGLRKLHLSPGTRAPSSN